MRKSEINLTITLDEQEIPSRLEWTATDKGGAAPEETDAFALFIWDGKEGEILPVNLWTNQMDKLDMKKFYINIIGSLAEKLAFSTEDYELANEMEALCRRMAEKVIAEIKTLNQQEAG